MLSVLFCSLSCPAVLRSPNYLRAGEDLTDSSKSKISYHHLSKSEKPSHLISSIFRHGVTPPAQPLPAVQKQLSLFQASHLVTEVKNGLTSSSSPYPAPRLRQGHQQTPREGIKPEQGHSGPSPGQPLSPQGAAALGCPREHGREPPMGFFPPPGIFLTAFQDPINPWYPQGPGQCVSHFYYTLHENISHCLL